LPNQIWELKSMKERMNLRLDQLNSKEAWLDLNLRIIALEYWKKQNMITYWKVVTLWGTLRILMRNVIKMKISLFWNSLQSLIVKAKGVWS
jgi:hypothetical protein